MCSSDLLAGGVVVVVVGCVCVCANTGIAVSKRQVRISDFINIVYGVLECIYDKMCEDYLAAYRAMTMRAVGSFSSGNKTLT